MAFTGSEWIRMTISEMRSLFYTAKCIVCKNLVDPNSDYAIDNNPVHADCDYDEFSKELDEHPIGIPRMHR